MKKMKSAEFFLRAFHFLADDKTNNILKVKTQNQFCCQQSKSQI